MKKIFFHLWQLPQHFVALCMYLIFRKHIVFVGMHKDVVAWYYSGYPELQACELGGTSVKEILCAYGY